MIKETAIRECVKQGIIGKDSLRPLGIERNVVDGIFEFVLKSGPEG
jgi:hypothetical protein